MPIKVTVWNERELEQTAAAREIYPQGKQNAIKEFLSKDPGLTVTATDFDKPEQGLSADLLDNTDVLLWWGHARHDDVQDETVERVANRVLGGMGFIALHSSHRSRPFKKLLGTEGTLHWGDNMKEVVWNVMPAHPISKGVPEYFALDMEEMYCEPFDIPQPDELVFISWFKNGYVFRSGCAYYRGNGKIFYFQPGHETFPSFYDENVQKVLTNAVFWAAPSEYRPRLIKGMPSQMTINLAD